MTATITKTEKTILVTGDYNAKFVGEARRLGGKWKAPAWVFDVREEAAVRAACLECYGTDGNITDLVDVRVTINKDLGMGGDCGPMELFGRTLARAFGRDSGAKIGEGVVIEKGGFSSGGSMKNWVTKCSEGTVVILRDISRALVEAHDLDHIQVEIIGGNKNVDRTALEAERAKLLLRLAEIDAALVSA